MKLYGHPSSTCTRKVLAVLHARGASFDLVLVDTRRGEHKQPAHLARQPFGQVPAWEDADGFALYESRAICRHVDEVLPGARLTPLDPRGRAVMEQWISVEASTFTPPAMQIVAEALYKRLRGGKPDPAVVEAGRAALSVCLAVMDERLRAAPFLSGDELTLADVFFMPCLEYLFACQQGDLVERHDGVNGWWRRLAALPFWKATTAQRAR